VPAGVLARVYERWSSPPTGRDPCYVIDRTSQLHLRMGRSAVSFGIGTLGLVTEALNYRSVDLVHTKIVRAENANPIGFRV